MNFDQIISLRYSVRKYADRQVDDEAIKKLLLTAQFAPSAVNYQPVRIIVVQEEQGLKNLAKATKFYSAPLGIIVCADKDVAWTRECDGKNHCDIDASIITDHMMLKATELGLGSVWICRFDPIIVREEFNIPPNWEPVNILALGYPAEDSQPSSKHASRRALEEFVFWETVNNT